MFRRLQKLHASESFLLFGPRGSGKSTLLKEHLGDREGVLWIDLLKDADDERFGRDADELSRAIAQTRPKVVVIDEVQKHPKLLDVVHVEIEKKQGIQFIATGSSARKLKRESANLLAGRAFSYSLFPLTHLELGEQFDLARAMSGGTLPRSWNLMEQDDVQEFLRSYARTYLKEEVLQEQLVRQAAPFQSFLEVAAQMNGKIVNFSRIAADVGVDDKTVRTYFEILQDTYLGFYLPAFHRSVRKRFQEAPKFYLFDLGVKRALDRTLRVELVPGTSAYGEAFESWVVLEVYRLNEYRRLDYKLSHLRTYDGPEIDLVIERPGASDLLVEIKSSMNVKERDLRHLKSFRENWDRDCEAQVWSLDPLEKRIDGISCLPWQKGLAAL